MASVMAAPAAHNRYSAAVPVPVATVYTVELPPVLAVYTEMLLPILVLSLRLLWFLRSLRCRIVNHDKSIGIVVIFYAIVISHVVFVHAKTSFRLKLGLL